jgi:hypothetical protein
VVVGVVAGMVRRVAVAGHAQFITCMSQLVDLCPLLHSFNLASQHLPDVQLQASEVAVAKIRRMAFWELSSDAGEVFTILND